MKNKQPECYGDLDQVFPMTKDGLRHYSGKCMACNEKFPCLKAAMAGKNQIVLQEEKLDRAYQSGKVSFLQRCSKKNAP